MTKKIMWLVVSGLMVLSLVMAACGPAPVEEEKGKEAAPVVKEEKAKEEKGAVEKEVVEKEAVSPEVPKYGGVLVEVQNSDIRGWDDAIAVHAWLWNRHPVSSRLLIGDWTRGPSGTGELAFFQLDPFFDTKMGQIVESYQIFPEGNAIYKIRKGIHYALNPDNEASKLVGGRELTADDVAYSLNRLVTLPTSYIKRAVPDMAEIVKITALDKYTLEIALPPDYTYEGNYFLSMFAYADVPREVIEKYGNIDTWENVVGTGPFMVTDYVPASAVTFTRNPNYFARDPVGPGKGNQLPYVDGLRQLIIPDLSTRLAALRTGKVDFINELGWDDGQNLLKTAPQLEYKQGLDDRASGVIYMRTDKPELPYDDVRVRQALMLATDYKTINDTMLGGKGLVPSWPAAYQPGLEDYYLSLEDAPDSVKELYTYNPEKAKKLLAEAGYPDGFTAKIIVSSASVDEVAIFKAMWAKVGVDLEFEVKEPGVFRTITRKRSHTDMIYGGGSGISIWARLGNIYGDVPQNLSMVNEDYIFEARRAKQKAWLRGDKAEETRILKELLARFLGEAWAIPYPQKPIYNFWWPWLKNYNGASAPGAFTGPPYQYVWIDQELKTKMLGQ